MKFELTRSGMGVIRINTDTYLSFGNSDDIKFINIRYGSNGKLFPVEMLKLPKPATKAIGMKNIKLIRELVRERLVDGALPKDKVMEIGEIINRESKD